MDWSASLPAEAWRGVGACLHVADLVRLRQACKTLAAGLNMHSVLLLRLRAMVPAPVLRVLQPDRVALTGSTMTQLVFDERYADSDVDLFCAPDAMQETLERLRALVPDLTVSALQPYMEPLPVGMDADAVRLTTRQGLRVSKCASEALNLRLDLVTTQGESVAEQIAQFDIPVCRARFDGRAFTVPFALEKRIPFLRPHNEAFVQRKLRAQRQPGQPKCLGVLSRAPTDLVDQYRRGDEGHLDALGRRCCAFEFKHWRWSEVHSRALKYARRGFTPEGWCSTCASRFLQGYTFFASHESIVYADWTPCDEVFWNKFDAFMAATPAL